MADDDLLIDLHLRNDRQGPGGDADTRRALEFARRRTEQPLAVADLGCGTGASTLVLAKSLSQARITAVDLAQPFLDRLAERAAEQDVAERIQTVCADLEDLPFDDARFDVVWSEGAVYNIGFRRGLRDWRRLLRPGGFLAVTELTWTTPDPPPIRPNDVHRFWTDEYPGISTPAANLARLEDEGYRPLAMFFLPRHCWEANYYIPLELGFADFLKRHGHSDIARAMSE